jgi:hypothetical protein
MASMFIVMPPVFTPTGFDISILQQPQRQVNKVLFAQVAFEPVSR